MLKISYLVCLSISLAIKLQRNLVLKYVVTRNREKFTKNPLFWWFKIVQCHRCWHS